MRVRITNFVTDAVLTENGDFDEEWAKMGTEIKQQLRTFDPNVTWLNLYLSHDGKPSYNRTIETLIQ